MGTHVRLVAYAGDRQAGLQRLEVLLQAIEQTERQISTWLPRSDLSRINDLPPTARFELEPGLCSTLQRLAYWHAQTGGAFDPAVGALVQAWGLRGTGAWPDDAALARTRPSTGFDRFDLDVTSCTIARTAAGVTIDAGGFGKGEALHRARVAAGSGGAAWMVNLGGQVAVGGGRPPDGAWTVGVAHPSRRNERLVSLELTDGSLAVSGGSERDLRVDGRRVGHVIDPRTGYPARFDGSVVVWHAEALVADVLSTALYVMGPDDGLAWADARGLVAAFLAEMPDRHGSATVRIARTDAFIERFGEALLRSGPVAEW